MPVLDTRGKLEDVQRKCDHSRGDIASCGGDKMSHHGVLVLGTVVARTADIHTLMDINVLLVM